jgi:RNA polymerase sigma-70 factor (ECF subfamily)
MGSGASPSPLATAALALEPARTPPSEGRNLRELEVKVTETRVAELLRLHFRAVWRAVRRLGVTEDVADDAAQEVFIVAARKLDAIEPGGERAYLYGIAVRIASNARRARRTRREDSDEDAVLSVASEAPRADALLEKKRLRELLDVVLDGLSDDLRTVFVLFELEGFSMREIAELLDLPAGTVASRLRRGREAFQAAAERVRASIDHVVGDES